MPDMFIELLYYHRKPFDGELHCDCCKLRIKGTHAWRRFFDERPMCDDCYFEHGVAEEESDEGRGYVLDYYRAKWNVEHEVIWD